MGLVFIGIYESSEPIKTHFLNKVIKFHKIPLRFTGMTQKNRCSQRNFRDIVSCLLKYPEETLSRSASAHVFKQRIRNMLHRHVDVWYDFIVGTYQIDKFQWKTRHCLAEL